MSLKFLGWIMPTIRIPEEFYINNIGLDAVMFLRFLKMCLQFCIFNGIIAGIILLPIHYTAGGESQEVQRFSILNVLEGSNLLWAHVFLVYLASISWMFLLFKNYWQWMDLRREYTLQRIRQGEIAERSIFISRLPSNLRSDAALKQYFESLKMGPVESATVVQHCGRLAQKIDRRESTLNMLEKAHIDLAREVLDSIKKQKFHISSPLISTTERPLLQTPSKRDSIGAQSSIDVTALEKMVQDMYQDKKRYHKLRKSIFAHKRVAIEPPQQPQLSIPLSALSHHSDIIDVYVNGGVQEVDASGQHMGSTLSLNPPPFTIWNALATLDRSSFDKFQPTRPANRFKGGEKVNAIDVLTKKYNRLDRKVGELRDGSLRYKSTSYGFVTFKHHLSAQLCAQAKIDSRPQGLSVRLAMEPRDVLWSNLTASFRNRFSRSLIVNISIWVLIVFWIFPTSSFLLLTSLQQLSEKFKFLKPIVDASPLMQSLLQNVLPIVFVTIFLALAPVIILEISKQELPVSHSALEGNVFRRYYHFLIFNVLFVFMIGTVILKSILELIREPTNIFSLLATNLPSGSTFFIFYIVFNTCTHSLELVQVWAQLIIHAFVTSRKLAPTPRALQRATVPWCFQYYYYYPQNILALVIIFIYSVIAPLILIAGIPYFAFALLVFKYQFAYCYVRKYENSGRFFRHVFQYTTDGLIIFQITMVGILWLKKAIVGGFLVVVLIGITAYFKIICGDLFKSRTKFLPLDTGLRNFDNDSSCAMNEIPMHAEEISAHSSSISADPTVLRRRNRHSGGGFGPDKVFNGYHCEIDGTFDRADSGEFARPSFDHFHSSPPSIRSQKPRTSVEGGAGAKSPASNTLVSNKTEDAGEIGHSTSTNDVSGPNSVLPPASELVAKSVHDLRGMKTGSRNSLQLKINTKEPAEPSPASNESSTREIRLFTVGGDLLESSRDIGQGHNNSAGFLDEDGFYVETFGLRNAGMAARTLASHFDHTSSKITYQDRTSDFETYVHPALLKPLNRKMWLPKNPLYEHWDLDDTVEIDFALNSSATANKLELRVRDKDEDLLKSPRQHHNDRLHHRQQQQQRGYVQRRNTIGSTFDLGMGVSLPSPSNWEGCLSDIPISNGPPSSAGLGSNWDRYDEKRGYDNEAGIGVDHSTTTPTFLRHPVRGHTKPSQKDHTGVSGFETTSPMTATTPLSTSPITHSASMSTLRMFSPSTPRAAAPPQSPQRSENQGGLSPNNTRFKRSASMPPAPLPIGTNPNGDGSDTPVAGSSSGASPQPTPSPFLSVRYPHHGYGHGQAGGIPLRSNTILSHSPQQPSSAHQSPRVSFVQDTTGPVSTPLTIRSTMFAGPVMQHRHTISHGQGNNFHHGSGPHRRPSMEYGMLPQSYSSTSSSTNPGPFTGVIAGATVPATAGTNTGVGSGAGTGTVGTAAGATTAPSTVRKPGVAGAFFNMIFGDPEDDVLEANENPRFGYETGGRWSRRRGSMDHHDDDDDDDDDDEEEDYNNFVIGNDNNAAGRGGVEEGDPSHTVINIMGTGAVDEQSGTAASGLTRLLGQQSLAQPSHLDLSEDTKPSPSKV
ncbi:hypothetical protein EC991_001135 [Linnemannia zychae]|nr:hypothetical protein EC991_001135 [Linnemannia zychae]